MYFVSRCLIRIDEQSNSFPELLYCLSDPPNLEIIYKTPMDYYPRISAVVGGIASGHFDFDSIPVSVGHSQSPRSVSAQRSKGAHGKSGPEH